MKITNEQFDNLVSQTIDSLPDKFRSKINNVAIFVEDYPTPEQLKKIRLNSGESLFGLFEGYAQAKKLNFGPVLPDRITIFRKAIVSYSASIDDIKNRIAATVKHEIAHHFGSDEKGARKVG